MTACADEKGVAYTIQAGYATGGIVVLSDDKAAWRIDKQVLADASPVFRHMLAESLSKSEEIHLNESGRSDIEVFLNAQFDALVLASTLDDLTCACRILSQGWRSYSANEGRFKSLKTRQFSLPMDSEGGVKDTAGMAVGINFRFHEAERQAWYLQGVMGSA